MPKNIFELHSNKYENIYSHLYIFKNPIKFRKINASYKFWAIGFLLSNFSCCPQSYLTLVNFRRFFIYLDA